MDSFGPLIQWRAKWSDEQIAFNPGQRRAMTLIGAAPHAAQIAEGPCAGGDKTMVKPVDAAMAAMFSYRFQARLEPKWHEIIKKVFGLETKEEQLTLGEKLRENPHEDRMIGQKYDFTEFFNSSSGLTTRFERISLRRTKCR